MQHQQSLSSVDDVTARDKSDTSRLPSYRETRRYRYHPYGRPISVLVNEDSEDYLFVGFPIFIPYLRSLYHYLEYDLWWWTCCIKCSTFTGPSRCYGEFFSPYSDLIFKPNSYSTRLCPKLLTSSKSVSAKIWNAPLHLNYGFDAFPMSLWSVFFGSSSICSWPCN